MRKLLIVLTLLALAVLNGCNPPRETGRKMSGTELNNANPRFTSKDVAPSMP